MNRIIRALDEAAGQRIDAFLATHLPEKSRSHWSRLIKQGSVLVNNKPIQPRYTLTASDIIAISEPQQAAVPMEIPVLFQNDDVVVINKPAGILTHSKGARNQEYTVADFVHTLTSDDTPQRPGIVHRLDRATSGVLIAARSKDAKSFLQQQFSQRKAKKKYLALVEGAVTDHEAILDWPIERNPKKPQTFRVGANGKSARTHVRVIESNAAQTLVELSPATGRTHQLRIHMAHYGHPIIGDLLYGTARPHQRMLLHAYMLEITLPGGERRTFVAPPPRELQQQ